MIINKHEVYYLPQSVQAPISIRTTSHTKSMSSNIMHTSVPSQYLPRSEKKQQEKLLDKNRKGTCTWTWRCGGGLVVSVLVSTSDFQPEGQWFKPGLCRRVVC